MVDDEERGVRKRKGVLRKRAYLESERDARRVER